MSNEQVIKSSIALSKREQIQLQYLISIGLYGFALEAACLTLCVASVWAPGTPFDPVSVFTSGIRDPFTIQNATNTNSTGPYYEGPESYTSVILLMSGIICARFGITTNFYSYKAPYSNFCIFIFFFKAYGLPT